MKIFIGRVISTKRLKTATVTVENIVIHPLYKKRFRRLRKYSVHDDKGVKVGDTVKFITTRPYSKTVRWAITEIEENKNKKKVPVR